MRKFFRRFALPPSITKKRFIIAGICIVLMSVAVISIVVSNMSQNEIPDYAAAVVDGQIISYEELDAAVRYKLVFYSANNQQINEANVRSDTLESLIDARLVESFANQNSIFITDKEVEDIYISRIAQFDDEQALLTEVKRLYDLDKASYQNRLKHDLLREKVQASVGVRLSEWLESQRESATIERFL